MTRPDLLQHLPGVPESALTDALAAQLPASTPPAPWDCQVEAVIWWHRATATARQLLPAPLEPGLPITVGAFVRYLSTPVGPYSEVLASPHLVAGALRRRAMARVPTGRPARGQGGRCVPAHDRWGRGFPRTGPSGRPRSARRGR